MDSAHACRHKGAGHGHVDVDGERGRDCAGGEHGCCEPRRAPHVPHRPVLPSSARLCPHAQHTILSPFSSHGRTFTAVANPGRWMFVSAHIFSGLLGCMRLHHIALSFTFCFIHHRSRRSPAVKVFPVTQ